MPNSRKECRWCGEGPLVHWNDKWHHTTERQQKECPYPVPFADQLDSPTGRIAPFPSDPALQNIPITTYRSYPPMKDFMEEFNQRNVADDNILLDSYDPIHNPGDGPSQ